MKWFSFAVHPKVTFVNLTNHLKLEETTIVAIYKDRWQIELFFKALKQELKIKTFVGISANAVKIQIWTTVNSNYKPTPGSDQ